MTNAQRLAVPPGATDTHMHIYGTRGRTLDDYRAVRARLGIQRTVYVQPSQFGADNRILLECIGADGDNARGVAVIDPEAGDAELDRLHAGGVRAVRFHDVVKGCLGIDVLEPVAARVANWGWHVIVQSEGARLAEIAPRLTGLPVPVVVDHMGRIPVEMGVGHPAFVALLRLLEAGRTWVKLSAPYHVSRTGGPDYADLRDHGRTLVRAAPERMLWATNWPHPSVRDEAAMPDDADLLNVLADWTPDDATVRLILVDNPAALYGFDAVA